MFLNLHHEYYNLYYIMKMIILLHVTVKNVTYLCYNVSIMVNNILLIIQMLLIFLILLIITINSRCIIYCYIVRNLSAFRANKNVIYNIYMTYLNEMYWCNILLFTCVTQRELSNLLIDHQIHEIL